MEGFARGDFGKLTDLHRQMMEKFTYMTDQQKYGMVEHWAGTPTLASIRRSGVARFTGDCEEFALVAMEYAVQMGFNARLAICYVETGEGHAVCEVGSSDFTEAYYFDNRQTKLATAEDLKRYRFISVSSWNPVPGDTRPWYKVTR